VERSSLARLGGACVRMVRWSPLLPVSFTGRFVARTALRRAPVAFAAAEEPLSRLVRGRGVFSNRSEVDP